MDWLFKNHQEIVSGNQKITFDSIKENLLEYSGISNKQGARVILVEGSVTYSVGLVLRAGVRRGRGLLIIKKESGSDYLERIADHYNIPAVSISSEVQNEVLLAEIKSLLAGNRLISAVAFSADDILVGSSHDRILETIKAYGKITISVLPGENPSGLRLNYSKYLDYLVSLVPGKLRLDGLHSFIISDFFKMQRIAQLALKKTVGPY